jgi:hypothetical protein
MKSPNRFLRFVQRMAVPAVASALGAVALCHPTDTWRTAAVTCAALASLGSTIGALFGCTKSRPFRGGFAICCGGYFFLYWFAYGTGDRQFPNPYLESAATTKVLSFLHDSLFPQSTVKLRLGPIPNAAFPSGVNFLGGGFGGGAFDVAEAAAGDSIPGLQLAQAAIAPVVQPPANQAPLAAQMAADNAAAQCFLAIGQCLWALILGYAGGLFAQFLARRSATANDRPNPPPPALEPAPV